MDSPLWMGWRSTREATKSPQSLFMMMCFSRPDQHLRVHVRAELTAVGDVFIPFGQRNLVLLDRKPAFYGEYSLGKCIGGVVLQPILSNADAVGRIHRPTVWKFH